MSRTITICLGIITSSLLILGWQAHACLIDQSLLKVADERLASVIGGQTGTCYTVGYNNSWCYDNSKTCTTDGANSYYINYWPDVIYAFCAAHNITNSGQPGSVGCTQIDPQNCYVRYYCTGSTDCSSGCVRGTPVPCYTSIQPSGSPCNYGGT